VLDEADIVSGSRYLKVFDPAQRPPEERRKINVEVTRWLNECLGLRLTDAFCGFKAYRAAALAHFEITDLGYAIAIAGLGYRRSSTVFRLSRHRSP